MVILLVIQFGEMELNFDRIDELTADGGRIDCSLVVLSWLLVYSFLRLAVSSWIHCISSHLVQRDICDR